MFSLESLMPVLAVLTVLAAPVAAFIAPAVDLTFGFGNFAVVEFVTIVAVVFITWGSFGGFGSAGDTSAMTPEQSQAMQEAFRTRWMGIYALVPWWLIFIVSVIWQLGFIVSFAGFLLHYRVLDDNLTPHAVYNLTHSFYFYIATMAAVAVRLWIYANELQQRLSRYWWAVIASVLSVLIFIATTVLLICEIIDYGNVTPISVIATWEIVFAIFSGLAVLLGLWFTGMFILGALVMSPLNAGYEMTSQQGKRKV